MRKAILTVIAILYFAGNGIAGDISDQTRAAFRALEKVDSMSVSAIDNPNNYLEAVAAAGAETNLLSNMRESKCSKALGISSAYYSIAAKWLEAKNLDNYLKFTESARKQLNSAYKVCYPKGNK